MRPLKGFSLVELMVAVFIFSLIFAAIFMVLSSGEISWYIGDARVLLNQEIRKPLLTINKELRQSRASVISGVPADDNFYNTITFKLPEDTDGDGDVVDGLGNMEWSQDITYSLSANNQIIRTAASGSSVLASNISTLQFMRPAGNPDTVQINIAAQKKAVTGRNLQSGITTSIKMRN